MTAAALCPAADGAPSWDHLPCCCAGWRELPARRFILQQAAEGFLPGTCRANAPSFLCCPSGSQLLAASCEVESAGSDGPPVALAQPDRSFLHSDMDQLTCHHSPSASCSCCPPLQPDRPFLYAVEDPNDPSNDLGRNSYNISRVSGCG